MYRTFLSFFSLLLIPLVFSGCSSISWLGGEEDPRPPTKLQDLDPKVRIDTLWSAKVGAGTDERQLYLVPAIRGDRLYVADAEGHIVAMDAGTGKILWERETELPFSGGPEVDAKHIVLGSSDGDLTVLSVNDGSAIWNARLDSEILSVPRIAGSTVVVHTLDDSVYAYDLGTGDPLWKYSYPTPVLTLRGSSTPLVAGESAIVGISGGKLVKLELQSGLPLWETTVTPPRGRTELERIADIDATPVLVDDTIYVATYNGDLAAVDLSSGAVLWRRKLSAHAGLTANAGMLYITDSDDLVWAASPADGTGTWKQEALRYRRLTAPAVVGNLIAVGDFDGYLHWLDRRDGRLLARVRVAKSPITGRPQVRGGKLYVYGDDGTVTALSPGSPPAPPSLPEENRDAVDKESPGH